MKKALVVVDFQNDFISGALGFRGAEALRPIIVEKIRKALSEGADLIFTLDTHNEDYLSTVEGKGLPVVHCIRGTWGWELDDSVEPYASSAVKVIEKPTFGSFELGRYVREKGYAEVELCGLVASLCVLSNAAMVKAALPECSIVIDERATDDADPAVKARAIETMKSFMMKIES